MHIDLPTLTMMESFVGACTGVLLCFAWWYNRETPALALWGASNAINSVALLGSILGPVLGLTSLAIVSYNLYAISPALIWAAARRLDDRRAPLTLVFAGLAAVVLVGGIPQLRAVAGLAGAVTVGVGGVYFAAAARDMWRYKEPLTARRPIIFLLLLNAAVLLGTVPGFLLGRYLENEAPPLVSWFGLIHFINIIFSVGCTVLLLTLVKERKESALQVAARTDGLTGIANRAAFLELGSRLVERCRLDGTPVAVIMFDLDRFKLVNDTHGHAVGDEVLRRFCAVVRHGLRSTDLFGRLGGEEFAVVLPGMGQEAGFARAERLRLAFADEAIDVGGVAITATVSAGVAVSDDAAEELPALLEYADTALYRAKAAGRNRVEPSDQPRRKSSGTVVRIA